MEEHRRQKALHKYDRLEVVFLDEISMIGGNMYNAIDSRLRTYKGNPNVPFGGVHLIHFGDFYQLTPPGDRGIYAGSSEGIAALAENKWRKYTKMYELWKIMRQREDVAFAEALNRLRTGEQTDADVKLFSTGGGSLVELQEKEVSIIHFTNKKVQSHNDNVLGRLEERHGPAHVLRAKDDMKDDMSPQDRSSFLEYLAETSAQSTQNMSTELRLLPDLKVW
jgi:hypothetical protein